MSSPRVHVRSAESEAYFTSNGPADGPILIFFHIQKTAGTAFRRIVRANLPPSDLELGDDLRDFRYDPEGLLRWHREWYERLDADRRARLSCVMSHYAGYLLPALDRRAEALVVVREPVDRVLSFYWEKRRNATRRKEPGTGFNLMEKVYETPPQGRPPQAWPQFFNWQSRCLLSVSHDISELPASPGPPPDADLWRERVRELVEGTFYVGVQDRFPEFVELVGLRLGWESREVPLKGVNKDRPPLEDSSAELRETIAERNWLDVELYRLCRDVQLRRETEAGLSRG